MNTEQAYINGFVKRASQYGYTREAAFKLAGIAEDTGLDMKDLGLGGNEFSAKPSPAGIKINEQNPPPVPAPTAQPNKGFLSQLFSRPAPIPIAHTAK